MGVIKIYKMKIRALSFVISILLIFSSSCVQTTKIDNNYEEINLGDTLLNVQSVTADSMSLFQLTLEMVNLESIKLNFKNSYTSGVLPKSKSENFIFQELNNFFVGIYYFTDNTTKIPYVANAIIIRENNGEWNYIDNNEQLIEFSSYSNLINPFSEIVSIGQSKVEVVKQLGNEYKEIESNLIYSDSIGNTTTILFKNDTVQAIRVGKYKVLNEVTPINLKW